MDARLITETISRFPRFAQQPIAVEPVEKGGSDRRFYRIRVGEQSIILAKYGTQREENRHYVAIARFLAGIGVRVPEIYFHDVAESLIWMEDLGQRDLWSFRDEPWEVRRSLYCDALDQLLILHTRGHVAHDGESPKLQAEFNAELYRWEQNYFVENCLVRYFGLSLDEAEEYCDRSTLDAIADLLAAEPRVLVHRDFQSQNIVIKDGAASLIDFQGMRPGLAQYDLASLLMDPYVTLTEEERAELLAHYLETLREAGFEPAQNFERLLDLCAMQRLMQALGAYGFLGLVKEKSEFLAHIAPALQNLRGVLRRVSGVEKLAALVARLSCQTAAAA